MTKKQFIAILAPATWSASIIPIVVGTLYSLYHRGSFHLDIFIALLLATVGAQCFANIVNDYSDFKSGLDNPETIFGLEGSIIVSDGVLLSEIKKLAIGVLFFLLFPVGYLTSTIGIPIIIIGCFGLLTGILYSAGPLPLSTTCFGELCSGLVMGIFITGISYYSFAGTVGWNVLLVSIPVVIFITTMTFTNSICDMERDRGFRTTLALYLGKDKAIILLKTFYVAMYLFVFIDVAVGVLPLSLILIIFTLPSVWRRIGQINIKNTTIQNKYPIMDISCGSGIIFFKFYTLIMAGEVLWKVVG